MICYKDMIFCDFYKKCKQGDTCPKAYTEEVDKAATEWWGNADYPMVLFENSPECFESKPE